MNPISRPSGSSIVTPGMSTGTGGSSTTNLAPIPMPKMEIKQPTWLNKRAPSALAETFGDQKEKMVKTASGLSRIEAPKISDDPDDTHMMKGKDTKDNMIKYLPNYTPNPNFNVSKYDRGYVQNPAMFLSPNDVEMQRIKAAGNLVEENPNPDGQGKKDIWSLLNQEHTEPEGGMRYDHNYSKNFQKNRYGL